MYHFNARHRPYVLSNIYIIIMHITIIRIEILNAHKRGMFIPGLFRAPSQACLSTRLQDYDLFFRCIDVLVRRYSIFLYKYPQVFLVLTPVFFIICVIFSVPSIGPDLPDFSEPTKVMFITSALWASATSQQQFITTVYNHL